MLSKTMIFLLVIFTAGAVAFQVPFLASEGPDMSAIRKEIDSLLVRGSADMKATGNIRCNTCTRLTTTVRSLAMRNVSDEFIIDIGVRCRTVVPQFTPWLIQVFRHDKFDTIQFCGAVGTCSAKLVPWEPEFPSEKPPPRQRTPITPDGERRWVVQMSDWHYDPEYQEGYEAECADPICCRAFHAPNGKDKIKRPAGPFGDFHCDTPKSLAKSALEQVLKVAPNLDFVLMSGDLPPHDIWSTTQQSVIETEGEVARELLATFKDVPVYMTIGNHEGSPPNAFPTHDMIGPNNVTWLYESLSRQWSPWLKAKELTTLSTLGFYSTRRPENNLRIISLNTNFAYLLNWWIFIADLDPDNMLHWLIEELQEAENLGEDVYILGHIPPGSADVSKYWSAAFYKIVQRYHDTILGQFYGHTHRDEFELFYADAESRSDPINVAYLCPSITTFSDLNPGFRLFEIDAKTNQVVNHHTWIMDLEKSNKKRQPIWIREYDALSAYEMPTLAPVDWHDLTVRMEVKLSDNQGQDMLEKYLNFRSKLAGKGKRCNKKCRKEHICKMRSGKSFFPCKDHHAAYDRTVETYVDGQWNTRVERIVPDIVPFEDPELLC